MVFCFSDEAGDKALRILLSGAIFYQDLEGFKIYVKPGNEFEAQVEWFLIDPREIIHYVSNGGIVSGLTRYYEGYHANCSLGPVVNILFLLIIYILKISIIEDDRSKVSVVRY